ncbi:bifunctional folylpolyglutamate synthase/dihydrofolate synthase [SAR202 cluster bacterium AC-647-N09_OGT_505m]|nr:bifunctional folylpolyglutamate synthase/dihydrofolate synthase [SAR202 cluster bacterium AC-647-N09_OGT_505m]
MEYLAALDKIMGMVDYERPNTTPGTRARYDLNRIAAFLTALGDPHLGIPTVHIAGTKGKGSTAAMVTSVLHAAGYQPGLFTSPHLHTFRERIRVGDQLIPEEDFGNLVKDLWPTMEEVVQAGNGRVTLFEFLTAMAFYYFRNQETGAQVIEVGLGGRLDSTNLVQPLACGITSLGMDHTEVLGDTLEKIAGEKAGIIKPGIPVVCAPQKPEAMVVLQETCRQEGSTLTVAGEDIRWDQESSSLNGQTFRLTTDKNRYRLQIPLLGQYQIENAAVAIGILEALIAGGLEIGINSIEEGFRRVEWPCRLEVLSKNPLILADGAHNPHSAGRLVEAVKASFPDHRILLIVGVSGNKDLDGLVEELSLLSAAVVIATRSRHPRAAQPVRVAQAFGIHNDNVHVTDDVSKALGIAQGIAVDGDLVLITGSLFVAAEAREQMKGISTEIYPVIEAQATVAPPNV